MAKPKIIERIQNKFDKTGGDISGDINMNGHILGGANTLTATGGMFDEISVACGNETDHSVYVDASYDNTDDVFSLQLTDITVGEDGQGRSAQLVRLNGVDIVTNDNDAANKKYVDDCISQTEQDVYSACAKKPVTYTVTLQSSGWTGSSAPYTQSATVSGITSSDTAYIAPVYSTTNSTAISERDAWNTISKAETESGTIIFTCFEQKPTTNITLQIEVIR